MTAIGGKANVWLLCVCVLGCQSSTVADRATALSDSAISSYDVSPIGKQIVLSSASGELFLLDIATQRVERLTKTPHFDTTPAFSPDESFIVFASAPSDHSRSHIVRLSLVDKQVAQLTVDDNFYDSSPRFSRDGSRIVFSRAHRHRPYSMGGMTWDDWDIYVMDADGSNVNRVTNQKYRSITTPNFGNDGQTVFFSSRVKRQNSSRYSAIFRASISDEQPPTNLTPDDQNTVGSAALGSQPAVSTDGSMIVFISDRRTKYDYDL